MALVSVCRFFRNLACSTPLFWTFIADWMPEPALSNVLCRCQGSPVSVICDEPFLKYLVKFANPIRSLELGLTEGDNMQILFSPARRIESLTLWSLSFFDLPGELFSGEADQLVEVDLSMISLRWSSTALSGLKKLRIRDIHTYGPTVEEIVEILAVSPNLVYLELVAVAITSPHPGTSGTSNQAFLPKLRTLILRENGLNATDMLLRHIAVPAQGLALIHINPCGKGVGYGMLDETGTVAEFSLSTASMLALTEPLKALIAGGDMIRLEAKSCLFELEVASKYGTLVSLTVACPDSAPWVYWLIEVASEPLRITAEAPETKSILVVFDMAPANDNGELMKKLDKLPITELLVYAQYNVDLFLKYLSRPCGSHWPYRHLRELIIGQNFKTKQLQDMIHARYASLETSATQRESPVALHFLRFGGSMPMGSPYVLQIRNAVQRHGGAIDYICSDMNVSDSELESDSDEL